MLQMASGQGNEMSKEMSSFLSDVISQDYI